MREILAKMQGFDPNIAGYIQKQCWNVKSRILLLNLISFVWLIMQQQSNSKVLLMSWGIH